MIKTEKNILNNEILKDLENFRFKEGSWGPWDTILDSIPETDKCKILLKNKNIKKKPYTILSKK